MPTVLPLTKVTVNPSLKARAYTLHPQAQHLSGMLTAARLVRHNLWTAHLSCRLLGASEQAVKTISACSCIGRQNGKQTHTDQTVLPDRPGDRQIDTQTDSWTRERDSDLTGPARTISMVLAGHIKVYIRGTTRTTSKETDKWTHQNSW